LWPDATVTGQPAALALVVATCLHAGFQVVVTFLVYPAFRDIPESHWTRFHRDHTRRITWIVIATYALVLGASTWVLASGPRNAGTVTAVSLCALAVLTTAVVAAPAHGTLSVRRDRDLERLVRADRVRAAAAVLAAGAAVLGFVE
jgi:hypothetical protein